MKKNKFLLNSIFFLALLSILSCRKNSDDLRLGIQNASQELFTDTFPIQLQTVPYVTYTGRNLQSDALGYYYDPSFGSVWCGVATEFIFSSTPDFQSTDVLDSVVLLLKRDLGRSEMLRVKNTPTLNFKVYELNGVFDEDIEIDSDTILNYNPIAIGEGSISTGSSETSIRVKLSNTLGERLLRADYTDILTNDDLVNNLLNGLVIIPDTNFITDGGAIIPLTFTVTDSLQPSIRLYLNGGTKEYRFNNRTGSAEGVRVNFTRHTFSNEINQQLNSTISNFENVYMTSHRGVQVQVKIDSAVKFLRDNKVFPYTSQFILPVSESQTGSVISRLLLYPRNEEGNNDIGNFFDNNQSYFDGIYNEDLKQFSFFMNIYFHDIANNKISDTRTSYGFNLFKSPESPFSSQNIIFNSHLSDKNRPKLVITYTKIN
jgi:hypothetical protein